LPGQGRLGDKASIQADKHGCPGCPHPGTGPAIAGSADVLVNGRPAVRESDGGVHAVCCGPNTWKAQKGAPNVFINGKAAFRLNDPTTHCGGDGQLIEGSDDVIVGDGGGGGGSSSSGSGGGGGGGGGGGNGSGGGNGGGNGGGAATSSAAAASSSSSSQPAHQAEKPKAYVISRRLLARGNTPLREHRVEIRDPDSGALVGVPEDTDADGNLFVVVPENRPYDLHLVGDEAPLVVPADEPLWQSDEAVLIFRLITPTRSALGNERFEVRGPNGERFSGTTNADGDFQRSLAPGVYELTVRRHAYKLHTLRRSTINADAPCHVVVR